MPSAILTADTFDSIPVIILNTGQFGVVIPGITVGALSSAQSIDISGFDAQLSIGGTVVGQGKGLLIWDTNNVGYRRADVVIAETGSILSASEYAVDIRFNDVNVTNHGVIEGTNGFVLQPVDNTLIHNHGRITGRVEDGIALADATNTTILNYGIIEGNTAIKADGTSDTEIVNFGQIIGRNDRAILLDSSDAVLVNHGDIISTMDSALTLAAVEIYSDDTAEGPVLENYGLISSTSGRAVHMDVDAANMLTNDGQIVGQILFGAEGDTMLNNGLVRGEVNLSSGDDLLDTRHGRIEGEIIAGDGNDTLMGSMFDDTLMGGADNDMLRGNEGADLLQGEDGNDYLRGDAGDDTLIGDAGFDTHTGNGGDDSLDGGGRRDKMSGGKGDDTLTGGGGGDVFVIRRVGNGDDEVTDFQNGSDKLDISVLGVQNFNALNNTFGALSQDTDGVVIDLAAAGGSGSIRLLGVSLSDMDGTDFIF